MGILNTKTLYSNFLHVIRVLVLVLVATGLARLTGLHRCAVDGPRELLLVLDNEALVGARGIPHLLITFSYKLEH